MTSNTLPIPYVSSASTEYDSTMKAFYVFDGSATTYWVSLALPAQLELDLGSSGAQTVRSFAIMAGDLSHVTQAPKNFTFEGSNDNSTWNVLDTITNQTGWTTSEVRTFNNTATGSYRYYRLNVSANGAGTVYVRVAELYMYLEATYRLTGTGHSGGTNGVASQNFTVTPAGLFTGTVIPNDGGDGGTFIPTSLTWSGTQDAKTFTYTPASIGAKTISVTNDAGLTNPASIIYYSVTPYTILPSDLWENAYSTNETNYYLSSPFARLSVQTDATGLSFTVWRTSSSADKVAVLVNGTANIFTASVAGANTFYLDGLAAGQKSIDIISGTEWVGTPQLGTFLTTVSWFGANTTIIQPSNNKRITIYGDSILTGIGTSNAPTEAAGILIRNHYVNRSVLFESWASRTLKDDSTTGPPAVKQSLIDHLTLGNPTHIWLGMGVNDYGIAYGDLLDKLHSTLPSAHIIAQTPITQAVETANTFGNTLDDYRNKIIALAATRPWVILVNGPSLLSYPTDYNDPQHPKTAGNAKYASEMEPYLDLSSDATLNGLTISSGTLIPTFVSGTTSYTVSVANSVNSVTITPTVNQANATIKVNTVTVASGSSSDSISLNVGSNTITTVVTAEDGTTTDTYTIIVTRAANPAKAITAFSFNGLSPAVTGTIDGNYAITLTVPYGTSVTSLIPTIIITGSSINPVSGVARDFTTSQIYTVTAADSTTQNYTVTVAVANTTSSNNSTSTSTNSSSSVGTPQCNDTVTSGYPNLFEIRTNKYSATLFFAPPAGSYSSFYVAFSRKPDSWEYGTEYSQGQSGGVLQYTINELQPNTKYYIKIRAGNGCATGNWSNTMMVTTSSSTNKKVFYKNVFTAITQTVKSVINKVTQTKKTTDTTNQTPAQTSQPTVPNQPQTTTKPVTTQPTAKKFCILWWCF